MNINASIELSQSVVYYFIREKLWRRLQDYCHDVDNKK